MCSQSVFTCIMRMVNFTIVFIISVFMLKLLLQMQQIFIFSCNSSCSFVKGIIFFFSKLIIFNACSLKDSQNFFIQSSPLYTFRLFLYIRKYPYRRHRIPVKILLTYFCCRQFKIIQNYIHIHPYFNQRFKICINNRWYLIRFSILIKL